MNQLTKKLGPLPLWQWIAIGAAVGLAIAYWRKTHPGAASDAAAAVPSDAEFNPIDPTTGLPIAGGISAGPPTDTGASGTGSGSLSDLLSNFQALEGLLAGLQEISPGPAVETDDGTISEQTGSQPKKKAATPGGGPKLSPLERAKKAVASGRLGPVNRQRLRAAGYTNAQIDYHVKHKTALARPYAQQHPKKKSKAGGHKNPGHTVTHHGGGKKTAASSAPHNPRQHGHVQPPSHQRHPPKRHHSAKHPKGRR